MFKLKKNYEFRRVYRKGRRLSSRHLVLYCLRNKNDCNRFGFSVNKKVGKSVKRNRVRRIISESLRQMQLRLKEGYDIVVVAKSTAREMDYHDCFQEIEFMLQRTSLWRK